MGLLLAAILILVMVLRAAAPAAGGGLPTFLSHALGAEAPVSSLTRSPNQNVSVHIMAGGYSVSLAGIGTVAIRSDAATGAWTRFANGVSRRARFGHETIDVRDARAEELLTVMSRQGSRIWRWHVTSGALRPSIARTGAVIFRHGSRVTNLRIAPVRILGADGQIVTPAGARWSLRPDGHGAWWLMLHLDDRGLQLPYVIDPATDYPSPLYLSSTSSTETGSWRLLTTAPNAANTATSNTPPSSGTGYFLFRPGAAVTSASTPSSTPTGTGWIQDLAGGASFPAGSWSFTFKTQVPGTTLVAGTAVLAVGVWKGTVSSGVFHATQTILTPTPDPASQNIRASTGTRTTTVTYSLPAFTLGAGERLYIDLWRRQVTGINTGTASARQVILVVNDGVSRIVHPPAADADITPPTHAFGISPLTGGLYLTNPGGTTGTVYYRGSAAGSFRLTDTATDAGSGVASVTYPSVSTAKWTHNAETVSTGPLYTSSTYSWNTNATTSPGSQAIVATDVAGNATTGSPLTFTNDSTAPSTPSLALTSPPAVYTTPSIALTPTDGTDAGSGVNTASRVYQRDETTVTNGVCGTFPNAWAVTVSNPDTTVQSAKCYRYRLLESDRVGNQSAASAATATARVDLSGGDTTPPTHVFGIASSTGGVYFTNPGGATGTLYYRGSAAGSFRLNDTATDAGSGVAGVTYPLVATAGWTHAAETVTTGPGFTSSTYSWNAGATTSPGAQAIVAKDAAGNTTTGSPLTVTNDTTAPTTPSLALTSPPTVYTTASIAVTPTDGTDAGSGVDTTTRIYQRDQAAATNGVCGTFPNTWATVVQNPDTTVQNGTCYRYRLLESDHVGNQSGASAPTAAARVVLGDVTAPVQSFGIANPSGGVYFPSPGGATGTVYYRGSAAGSFQVTDSATDTQSGVASVTYPLVSTAGWTHAAQTVTTGPSYTSSIYSWTAGATTSPGAQAIVAQDAAGNGTTGSPLTFTNDATAPTTPSLALTSPPAVYTSAAVALTPTDGTDAGSGVDTSTRVYQRDETTETNGVCGTFPNAWGVTVSNPDTTVQSGECYQYRLLESDHVGNQSDPSSPTAAAVVDFNGGAPDTSITAQPTNPSNSMSASFSFTSPQQQGVTFLCSLDGATTTTCTSPMTYNELTNGSHTFTVAASANNLTDPSPASYTWTADTTSNPLAVDEVHYTFLGDASNSVSFDWRGTPSDIRYGLTSAYGNVVTAHTPTPLPYSSAGPFWQADLSGLQAGTTYHYSIGGGGDRTFTTVPTGPSFRFDAISDLGSSLESTQTGNTMNQVAADAPAFVLYPGDLAYGNTDGQAAVDQHFNDVMTWSQSAAYMAVWGNHEWDEPTDDLRNYKGRFELPNAHAAVGAPSLGCCGDDWGWFDAGGIRFISYPEPYSSTTWSAWQQTVDPIFAAAQADPNIHFIVTWGHRPPYSDGAHPGDPTIAGILGAFGDRYNKYVLNIDGHSHVYERFNPIHGIVNITVGNSGSLDGTWTSTDPRTAYRAMHRGHLVVDVDSNGLHISEICGPATGADDISCNMGDVIDSVAIPVPVPQPPPPPPAVIYVDNQNPFCTDQGNGSQTIPFCTIGAAAAVVRAGTTVQVASGTYNESVVVSSSGTAQSPVVFTTAPGANVVVTGGANGFLVSGVSWVTVDGFNVTNTTGQGILVQNSTAVTVSDNHVSYSGQPVSGQNKSGIYFSNNSSSVISGNDVEHNTSYGIYLTGCTNVLIQGNTSAYNAFGWQRAASGIRLYGSSIGNTITRNFTHDNEDSGIEFDGGSSNNLTLNNVSWNNGDHGIDDLSSPGQRIIGNSVYNNVAAGINVEGNSTGATIENNVSVNNGIGSPRTHSDIRVEAGSTSGTTMDYDLAYLTQPDTLLIWASVSYSSLSAFQAATGQEMHGVQADPKWTNPAGGDFSLQAGSPAIDSADAGNADESSTDVLGNPRVDDPRSPNTGAGPRGYDDRGAYEYQALPLDHITLSPSTSSIAAGGAQAYTVQATDTGGTSYDVTAQSTLTITPDGSCTGSTCTASTAGPHSVTATMSSKTATAALTVSGAMLDHIVVTPTTATVAANTAQAYTAQAFDSYGNSLGDVTAQTTFTISPNGSCSAASCSSSTAGAHTVTGNDLGKTATAPLTVVAGALDHIVISPSNATAAAGAMTTYSAQGFDSSGNSLGDVTATTSFSISPDGTCLGAVCSATSTGPHTVTGNAGGKTSFGTLTITAGTLDHLTITPASATIAAGGSKTYQATGRDSYGNSLGDVTAQTTFTIAPDGSCAAATCSTTQAGDHTVTGTDGAATGTADLQVTAGAPDHLVLSPGTASVAAGVGQPYTAVGFDSFGNSLGDVTSSTTFTIAPDGSCLGAICSAPTGGAHTVTGQLVGATGTAELDVAAAASVASIVVSPHTTSISAGGSATFTAQGFDSGNNSLGDVTGSTTFTISPDGSCTANVCTANQAGLHTVQAADGSATDSANLTVNAAALDHLVLSPAGASVQAGQGQSYTAAGMDRYGNSTGDVTGSTTFAISPDGSCVSNVCSATTAGAHTVIGSDGSASGTASLDVTQGSGGGSLDHIVVTPGTSSIAAGATQTYSVEGFDASNNSLGDVTSASTFTIAPDGSCGGSVCTATQAGPHTVTATDGTVTATATLTIAAGPLDHLVLAPATDSIASGGSKTYTASGSDPYGNTLGDVTSTTTFSISPNGSCTGATCTATQLGSHTVTGTKNGKTGTASLQVTAGTLSFIVVNPASASMTAGASQPYTANGYDSSGNLIGDVTANTTFTIAPDGSCTGATCTATTVGSHTVTANDGGKTSTSSLTVVAGSLDHLVLSPSSASIASGGSQAFTAVGADRYGNALNDVTSSSTFSIAPDGSCTGATCTATAAGTHTVTGTDGSATGAATLQVAAGPLDHITISPSSSTVDTGASQVYTTQAFDVNGNSLGLVTSSTSFAIAPNGSCTTNSCTATAGGVHTVTATFNGKMAQASLQINLVKNDGFETDLSGWNTSSSGANIVLDRVAGGHSGGWAARLSNTGTTTSTYAVLQDSPNWVATTVAGTYTASLWVRADSAGGLFKLKLQEYNGSTLVGSNVSQVTLTTSWQKITVTYTIASPGSTLDFQSYLTNPPPGVDFYADDASVTLG